MGTRGLESVLISNPGGGDDSAIWSRVRVAATRGHSGVLGVDLLDQAALFQFNAVLSFKSEDFFI
jgi:hypothetical protein